MPLPHEPSSSQRHTARPTRSLGTSAARASRLHDGAGRRCTSRCTTATHRPRVVRLPAHAAEPLVAATRHRRRDRRRLLHPPARHAARRAAHRRHRRGRRGPFDAPWAECGRASTSSAATCRSAARRAPAAPAGDLLQAGPLLVRDGAPRPHGRRRGLLGGRAAVRLRHHRRPLSARRARPARAGACSPSPATGAPTASRPDAGRARRGADRLGACPALNLDGGGSTSLVASGRLRNVPREVPRRRAGGRPTDLDGAHVHPRSASQPGRTHVVRVVSASCSSPVVAPRTSRARSPASCPPAAGT